MPDVVAKAMALISALLLVSVLALLYVTSRPPAGTREVVAEFRDAFPMLEGMQVRSEGAIAGSVGKIRLNDAGLAEVTLLVDDKIPAPRADAAATIRQADSTGDSYIAYDPGSAKKALPETDGEPRIACRASERTGPCTNTLAAPRFDDLINAFGPPEQAGIKLILQNLSTALAERGDDVNRAALRLVPALDSTNRALAEVNSQNDALKLLIGDMEAVTGQAASRRQQLTRLIESLDQTLATTAARTRPLDAGLQALPATQEQLDDTLGALTRTAIATRPLASELDAAAPGLSSLLDKAPGFIDDLRAAVKQGGPTLDLTRRLLISAGPTIEADPTRVVTGSFDLAPALSNLLKGILGGDDTIKALFGDEKDGGPESRPGFGFGLGAAATEPGNQPGYPADWADRRFLRVGGILNCESFGVRVAPGCLANVLAARTAKDRRPSESQRRPSRRPRPQQAPSAPPATKAPARELPKPVKDTVDGIRDVLEQTLDTVKLPPGTVDLLQGKPGDDSGADTLNDLLDYLLD